MNVWAEVPARLCSAQCVLYSFELRCLERTGGTNHLHVSVRVCVFIYLQHKTSEIVGVRKEGNAEDR